MRRIYGRFKRNNLYDTFVWILIIWCIFQEIVLSYLLKVTGAVSLVKVFFYFKDLLMILLFGISLLKLKMQKKIIAIIILYYFSVLFQATIGILSERSLNLVFSSLRGLILLPTMEIIGYSINNKERFFNKIKQYYKFIFLLAVIGLIEYVVDNQIGTSSFWMNFIGLEDFHSTIKGQPNLLFNGVPWNWFTNGSDGHHSQNRFIGIWAAPLTAGYVLLLPCMYYTLNFLSKRKFLVTKLSTGYIKDFMFVMVCVVSLYLTYTRQVILPYIVIVFLYFIYHSKRNRKAIILGSMIFLFIFSGILIPVAWDYIYNGSTIVHLQSIQNSLQHMNFWGSGIGSFGTRFTGTIATESQYMTVIGQLGVIPLFLYLVIMVYPIYYCKKNMKDVYGDYKLFIFSIWLSGVVFVASGMFSETVAAFTSMAQYYIFIGAAQGHCYDLSSRKYFEESESEGNVK